MTRKSYYSFLKFDIMKKYALMALIAIFTISLSVTAQDRQGRRATGQRADATMRWNAKERAENMAKQLDLTDAQKAEVEALFEKQDKQREEQVAEHRAKREELKDNREAQRAEMMELRNKEVAENDAELKKIIGEDKLEQWQKYREDNRRGRRQPSGRR